MARAQTEAKDEERTIVFVDESGFSLLPAVLRAAWTSDHLSVIRGITPGREAGPAGSGVPFQSPAVTAFLEHLRRHVGGKLLVAWDGVPIHRCKVIKLSPSEEAAEWLQVERLPAYAPELNPEKGLGITSKGV